MKDNAFLYKAQLSKLSIFSVISLKRSYIIEDLSVHHQGHRINNIFENSNI